MADIIHRPTVDGVARIRLQDQGDGTQAEVVALPPRYMTGTPGSAEQRLQVDEGQTGFFERRMFRAYAELNIPTAGPAVSFRFTSPINFILWEQTLNLDQGAARAEIFIGATPSGVWTPITAIGQNRMTEFPEYTSQVTVETGGSFTGGTAVDLIRVRTAAINNQATNVGQTSASERGLPAGTYFIRIGPLTGGLPVNDAAQGVYLIRWEERP